MSKYWLALCRESPIAVFLGELLFLLYTSALFSVLESKRIGYSDNSTLLAFVPSPGIRVVVAESLNRNLGKGSEWCDLWGIL